MKMKDLYMQYKKNHPDSILLFRFGEFYEAFFEDAMHIYEAIFLPATTRIDKDGAQYAVCRIRAENVENCINDLKAVGCEVILYGE